MSFVRSGPPGIRVILSVVVALLILGVVGILGTVDEFLVRHNAFKILSREGRLVAQEFAFGVNMRHEADRFLMAFDREEAKEGRKAPVENLREIVSIRREMAAVLAIRHNVTRVDLLGEKAGLPYTISTSGSPMSQSEQSAHLLVASGKVPWSSVRERTRTGDAIYVAVPFFHAHRAVGTVGVRLSYYEVDALVRQEKDRMALILLAGFLALSLGLSLVLKRWLIGPIQRLEKAMRAVGAGDLSQGFERAGSAEIHQAGDSFDLMVEMLRERTQEKETLLMEVRRLNFGLQDRIAEKTVELREKNRALERTNQEMYFLQRRISELERRAAVGEGMAVVAHELGNPLHSISGHLELLLEEPDLSPRFERPLRIISGQADRMIKFIRSLLTHSRSAGSTKEHLYLAPLLDEIVSLMGPRLKAAGVEISIDLKNRLLILNAETDALQSLFINLLENALDAIGRNGRIRIEGQSDSSSVMIHVRDSGPGIPEEIRDAVWKPFFTTKSSGTGLGLSVCRKIVDDLGGSILLGEGEGGHIVLVFPLAPGIPASDRVVPLDQR